VLNVKSETYTDLTEMLKGIKLLLENNSNNRIIVDEINFNKKSGKFYLFWD
jgi:hypothetical protein